VTRDTSKQRLAFLRNDLKIMFAFVQSAGTCPTLDTPEVLAGWQDQEEATELGVMIRDSSTQVIDLLRRGPNVVDHEMAIAEASVVRNQKSDGGVQMLALIMSTSRSPAAR